MEKKKTTAKIVFSLGEILVGNMMYAAAVVLFIVPNALQEEPRDWPCL